MKQRVLLVVLGLSVCLALIGAYVHMQSWKGFQGAPVQGSRAYVAELHTSDLRDGSKLGVGALYVARDNLRYELNGKGPLKHVFLLVRLDSGQARLVNAAGNKYLEGSFTPQRWMDIGHLLGAFPKVASPRIISSNEELLGREELAGYKADKILRTGREVLFGEEREFAEFFWLTDESCIPLRHENGRVRSELANIREKDLDDSLFELPDECRKVASISELLQ
ncbi:MAG: hypothetical protein LBH94_04790 [Deltaproteobacteria bacterium]|nr:hypothetical protein [Deltaproteobacteria bacterium]